MQLTRSNSKDTSGVLFRAAEEASNHKLVEEMGRGFIAMVSRRRRVYLYFQPLESIKWGNYASAIKGVEHFMTTYQYVELRFEVQLLGVMYGWGILKLISRPGIAF